MQCKAQRCYESQSRQLKNEGEKIFPRFARTDRRHSHCLCQWPYHPKNASYGPANRLLFIFFICFFPRLNMLMSYGGGLRLFFVIFPSFLTSQAERLGLFSRSFFLWLIVSFCCDPSLNCRDCRGSSNGSYWNSRAQCVRVWDRTGIGYNTQCITHRVEVHHIGYQKARWECPFLASIPHSFPFPRVRLTNTTAWNCPTFSGPLWLQMHCLHKYPYQ